MIVEQRILNSVDLAPDTLHFHGVNHLDDFKNIWLELELDYIYPIHFLN